MCDAVGAQQSVSIHSDGSGGAIIAWQDTRGGGGNGDIYAQRVSSAGIIDPTWPVHGRAVCTAVGHQFSVRSVSDGAGGTIVVWADPRLGTGNHDIYAQHVLASGALDPAWPADGLPVCAATGQQWDPELISDGAGGVVVTWDDLRSTTTNETFAQHVLASGAVDPAWPSDGRLLTGAAGSQYLETLVSDGSGGAIVTWEDYSKGWPDIDVYAQRVLASGIVDPAWPASGRLLFASTADQEDPMPVSDGAGGAVICWEDARNGDFDIYAHHILATGALDSAWPADGRAVCLESGNQRDPQVASNGAGGVIVTWSDSRGADTDVYAHRVLAGGTVDPAWPANGRAICSASGNQSSSRLVPDGAGGAIVSWSDFRSTFDDDVYAQRVLVSGDVDPAWPADGQCLAFDINDQESARLASDGAGGAIVAWEDNRSGAGTDVYAQRVHANGDVAHVGPVAHPASVSLRRTSSSPSTGRASFELLLSAESATTADVLDVTGRQVHHVISAILPAGSHRLDWDGLTGSGARAANGVYFLRVQAGAQSASVRFAMVR